MRELSAAAWEHFQHPRNLGSLNPADPDVAAALVGEPVSGAMLRLHLRIDAQGVIRDPCFKAYGCGWTIAFGSLLTECVQGHTSVEIASFRHHELLEKLDAPPEKLHCAVLAETALKAALRAHTAKLTPQPVIQSDDA